MKNPMKAVKKEMPSPYLGAPMSFEPLTVEGLIRQIKDGREEFFNYIDPQIRQIVKKVCAQFKVLEYYEEILGSVYEKAVHGVDRLEGATWGELKAWLYKTANHATLDFITRTLGKTPPKMTETIENHNDLADRATANLQNNINERIDLIRFFEALDPTEGFILMLYASFEYTFDEIARITKMPSYKVRRIYIGVVHRFQEAEPQGGSGSERVLCPRAGGAG